MYKYFKNSINDEIYTDCIIRKSDNAFIPFDQANKDYQEYLEWLSEGNTPEEAE